MDTDARKKLIDQYKEGYRVVAEALVGAGDAELNARPAPGKRIKLSTTEDTEDTEDESSFPRG
jgi:hypothetical protein